VLTVLFCLKARVPTPKAASSSRVDKMLSRSRTTSRTRKSRESATSSKEYVSVPKSTIILSSLKRKASTGTSSPPLVAQAMRFPASKERKLSTTLPPPRES